MDNGYISVKEFSKLAGVTTAYIYKLLKNDSTELTKFQQTVDGKKLIHINALSIFNIEPVDNQLNKKLTTVDSQLTTSLQATIDILKAQNETLNKQIIEQNNQINSLMELNKNNQILLLNQQNLLSGTVPEQKKRVSLWDKIFNRESKL